MNAGVPPNPPTALTQASTQFDVFDTWPWIVGWIEAASPEECLTSNRSQPGPEGRGALGGEPVSVMVPQVYVLAGEAPMGRRIVIGSIEGREAVIGKGLSDPMDDVLVNDYIRVHENNDVSLYCLGAQVPGECRTTSDTPAEDHPCTQVRSELR